MTTERNGPAAATILDSLSGTRDALSVRRVFGDPYEIDGMTIIPVARISGGAGGGGGEGSGERAGGQETGSGFGTGFGVRAQPVGVYEVRDGQVAWRPIVDISEPKVPPLVMVKVPPCRSSSFRPPSRAAFA